MSAAINCKANVVFSSPGRSLTFRDGSWTLENLRNASGSFCMCTVFHQPAIFFIFFGKTRKFHFKFFLLEDRNNFFCAFCGWSFSYSLQLFFGHRFRFPCCRLDHCLFLTILVFYWLCKMKSPVFSRGKSNSKVEKRSHSLYYNDVEISRASVSPTNFLSENFEKRLLFHVKNVLSATFLNFLNHYEFSEVGFFWPLWVKLKKAFSLRFC